MSTIINELFKENFLRAHIEKTLIPEYARRYALFLAAIKHDLYPLGFRLDETVINRKTVGGFFYLATTSRRYRLLPTRGTSSKTWCLFQYRPNYRGTSSAGGRLTIQGLH